MSEGGQTRAVFSGVCADDVAPSVSRRRRWVNEPVDRAGYPLSCTGRYSIPFARNLYCRWGRLSV